MTRFFFYFLNGFHSMNCNAQAPVYYEKNNIQNGGNDVFLLVNMAGQTVRL